MEERQKLCDELLQIGRRLEECIETEIDMRMTKALADILWTAREKDVFLPFSCLAEELELNEAEQLLLCLLWYLSEKHTDAPAEKIRKLCQKSFPVCFWHYGDRVCLSPVTIAFLRGEMPGFESGVELRFPQKEICYGADGLLQVGKNMLQKTEVWDKTPAALVLCGEEGSGRHFLAEQIAAREETAILFLADTERERAPREFHDILLCARLYHALICVEGRQSRLLKRLSGYVPFLLLVMEEKEKFCYEDTGYILNMQEITAPSAEVKQEIIRDILEKQGTVLPDGMTVNLLLSKQLPIGSYLRFVKGICLKLRMGGQVSEGEIHETISGQLTWLPANRTFEELKLPNQQYQQLRKICGMIGARRQVLEQWGYGRKYKYGNGISVLFYGSPGTGKTMAAQVLANALGLPLFRVDLSRLTSKYIGETQKNIGKIFEEAKKNECILFFDEADAIFAKRSEVSDAQDRYSNAETAYLLQCMEQYDGISVLATNFLQNFDEAFRRRITYMIHFPMPDENLRAQLWQSVFPEEAQLSSDIDYEMLAKTFEMSGASIKNASFHAACCAWAENSEIRLRHLLEGIQNEYVKTGKSFDEEQCQLQKALQEE